MRWMSAAENPPSMQRLREHRKAIGHRRIDGLAKIGGKNAVLRARFADAHHHFVPGRFAGVHGGEAMFDQRAFVRQFSLLVGRQALRRELGVRHQHALAASFRARRAPERKSLCAPGGRWP